MARLLTAQPSRFTLPAMTEKIDTVVVGAGVVGLAVARALALKGREVIILEAEETFGTVTSSRNSEVIHAGVYYAEGSLKARLCVTGNRLLYAYCTQRGINHDRVEKLIVATSEEEAETLHGIQAKAAANGVSLDWLDKKQAEALEPALHCHGALLSPTTGILDSHGFMVSLLGDAEAAGAAMAVKSPALGGRVTEEGIRLHVGGAEPMDLLCTTLVNCAGHGAQSLASRIDGIPAKTVPPHHMAKGNYFYLSGKAPFHRLIYPVPCAASLGLHYTRDLGHKGRFGPDVEWVETMDYGVDEKRAEVFYGQIRRYWPDLEDGALEPGYAGIRPKIQAPGEPAHDFVIQGPRDHGINGYVALYGIESPGLTASLAIGDFVRELVEE